MSKSVKLYEIYCETEGQWQQKWDSEEPKFCPNNNTPTIDPSSISIIDKIDNQEVKIKEESTETGGNFASKTISINAKPSNITSKNISWPFPISALSVGFVSTEENVGDTISLIVNKDSTIGTNPLLILTGTQQFTVSQTVIDNTNLGYYITLQSSDSINHLGRVLAIDKSTNKITTEYQTSDSFPAFSSIKQSVYILKDWEIGPPCRYEIGNKKIGGSYIPTGIEVSIEYNNLTGNEKKFVGWLEHLY